MKAHWSMHPNLLQDVAGEARLLVNHQPVVEMAWFRRVRGVSFQKSDF